MTGCLGWRVWRKRKGGHGEQQEEQEEEEDDGKEEEKVLSKQHGSADIGREQHSVWLMFEHVVLVHRMLKMSIVQLICIKLKQTKTYVIITVWMIFDVSHHSLHGLSVYTVHLNMDQVECDGFGRERAVHKSCIGILKMSPLQ